LKVEVSSAALLAIAVSLLTLGIDFLKSGQVEAGVSCVIVGFGLMVATIILLEKGIISKLVLEMGKRYG
jgi:hypothetical protein